MIVYEYIIGMYVYMWSLMVFVVSDDLMTSLTIK